MNLEKQHPLVHFAHANGFPASSYKRLFAQLDPDLSVIAVEKFAHNPQFPVSLGWQNQVNEMLEFITQQTSKPVYAVGHSFGAVISYLAVCQQPERFKGLIMLDPPLITGVTNLIARTIRATPLYDKLTPAKKAQSRCTSWPEHENVVDYFVKKPFFKNMHIQCVEDYVSAVVKRSDGKQLLHFDNQVEADIFRTIPLDISKHYGKLSKPALLITGQNTTVCTDKLIQPFIKGNKLEHIRIENGGHMFPLEMPDEIGQLIKQRILQWEK